jgi:hypothetical protein
VQLTDIRLPTKQLLAHLPERVQHLLGALPMLAREPWHAPVLALLLRPRLDVDVDEPHAHNVARVHVDALVRVLGVTLAPPVERARCVCRPELLRLNAIGEDDLEHDVAHALVVERCKVGIVDLPDVRDQRGKHRVDHVGGVSTFEGDGEAKSLVGETGSRRR